MALWQNEGPSSSFRHLLKIIKITRLLPLAGSKTKRNTYDLLLIVQDGSVPSFFIIEDCLFLFIPTSEASLRINGIKQTRHEFQSHCVILQMVLSDLMFHFSCTYAALHVLSIFLPASSSMIPLFLLHGVTDNSQICST